MVGIRPAPEGGRGVLKLRRQPNGRSRLIDAKRFFGHHGLALDKARGLAVETSAVGGGFRPPEQTAEPDEPAKGAGEGRRRTAGP